MKHRRFYTILIVLIAIGAMYLSYIKPYLESIGVLNHDAYVFQKKLQKVVSSGAEKFNLRDITDFDWDRVSIHLPYNVDTYQVDWEVSAWSMYFYKEGNPVKHFDIDREVVDIKQLPIMNDPYRYDNNVVLKIENKDSKLIILE